MRKIPLDPHIIAQSLQDQCNGRPRLFLKIWSFPERWKPSITNLFFQPQVENQYPPQGIEHDEFCRDMNGAPLPHDSEARKNFDIQETFVLGDPAASFDRPSGHTYECKYKDMHMGLTVWKKIFAHILRNCGYLEDYDTIYVLVDTRNLADHQTHNPGLPHWPAAVAWWESRLQMTGPMGERTELCFFPATEATGLHNVHPT